jgi:hypothetical protein
MVRRDIIENGDIRLSGGGCTFLYRRLRPGVLCIHIEGNDTGQFGPATLDEISQEFARAGKPLEVFIDTRRATGPSTAVMETWTAWLAANRDKLQRLTVLIPESSKLVHLTVSIAKHLSRTGDLLQICSGQEEFEEAIRAAVPA